MIFLAALSSAQTTTYSYQGNPYTYIEIVSPSVCPIHGSFTTSKPIPPNYSGSLTPESFSFTDCVNTITNKNNTGSESFDWIGTDGLGQINFWTIWVSDDVDVLINDYFTAFYGG